MFKMCRISMIACKSKKPSNVYIQPIFYNFESNEKKFKFDHGNHRHDHFRWIIFWNSRRSGTISTSSSTQKPSPEFKPRNSPEHFYVCPRPATRTLKSSSSNCTSSAY